MRHLSRFRRSVLSAFVVGVALWFLPCLIRAADPAEIPNDTCLQCHSDKSLTKTNARGKEVSLFVDEALLKGSVHTDQTCIACHKEITGEHPDNGIHPKPVDCRECHEGESQTYQASVHGIALNAGNTDAPVCIDCHGSHDVLPHTSPASPMHFSNLAATCGACHVQESDDVLNSVHGRATAKGEREAATCIDCHNGHQIEQLKGTSSSKVTMEICGKCHASSRINAKFHMPIDRVSTFLGSYHGLASQGGSTSAANCASCHGYHKILPSSDPGSSIHPSNLVDTCGNCHPGATKNFALSRVHTDDHSGGDTGAEVNRWVRRLYLGLIFTVIGSLSLHNLLSWLRLAIAARRARGPLVMRMPRGLRIQHFILLTSFVLLALTGFALKYPDTWLAWMFGSDENIRRWLHRGAGIVLIGLGIYHLGSIVLTRSGRRLAADFLPCWQDGLDLITNLRYYTGHGKQRAKFARFGYPQKLEYWAVVWGILIMGVTGLMIWLKMDVTRFLPRWIVEVAVTVHYYEAILACLAIVVWHLYQVIFAPDVYPMNWAWWDGYVSKHWQEKEHPRDPSAPPVNDSPQNKRDQQSDPPSSREKK